MRGAGCEIAVVQIIRLDPAFNESPHQRFQGRGIVVDASEQYRLAHHWNAGVNNAGTNYTVQNGSNGFNIASLGYTPRTVVNTPEPSSIALFGAGIFAFVGIRRLRRSRQH